MPASTLFSPLATRESTRVLTAAAVLDIYASLKPIDIEFMRQLHTKVNLIPVIAKADTLTDEEIANFKARVRHDKHLFPYSRVSHHDQTDFG